jgi:hypothetical protein
MKNIVYSRKNTSLYDELDMDYADNYKEFNELNQQNDYKQELITILSKKTKLTKEEIDTYVEEFSISVYPTNETSTLKIQIKKMENMVKYELYRKYMIDDIQRKEMKLKREELFEAKYRSALYLLKKQNIPLDLRCSKQDIIDLYRLSYNTK